MATPLINNPGRDWVNPAVGAPGVNNELGVDIGANRIGPSRGGRRSRKPMCKHKHRTMRMRKRCMKGKGKKSMKKGKSMKGKGKSRKNKSRKH